MKRIRTPDSLKPVYRGTFNERVGAIEDRLWQLENPPKFAVGDKVLYEGDAELANPIHKAVICCVKFDTGSSHYHEPRRYRYKILIKSLKETKTVSESYLKSR